MSVTAHMVVKNEDQWVWFAIMSVIDFVDEMIIFDTGSKDKTVEIINTILDNPRYKDKIFFEEIGEVPIEDFYKIRQKQLNMTKTDYILILDGDEIWWEEGIKEFKRCIDINSPSRVAVRFVCPCTDIYHYRDFERELYSDEKLGIKRGSITTRGYSMSIPGLRCGGDYGVETYYYDRVEFFIVDSVMIENFYFHCSKLRRSSAVWGDESIPYRRRKVSDDWDYEFPKDYKYPEVFYINRPDIVPNPFESKDNLTKQIVKKIARIYRRIRYTNE